MRIRGYLSKPKKGAREQKYFTGPRISFLCELSEASLVQFAVSSSNSEN